MQVSMWMHAKPYCVTAEERLDVVWKEMRARGFRHAPVVDAAGVLTGMLSDRDLREHKGYLDSTNVSAAMTEPALSVRPDDPIEVAARLLLEHRIGGLPVVDAAGQVVGIVTETDLLRGFLDSAAGEHAARIDFHFTGPRQGFSDAVRAVEGAGGTVLGLGTFQCTADGSGARRFFVRVTAPHIESVVDAMARNGVIISGVHPLSDVSA
jgi:acetoin utilization protein AcuB